MNEAVFTFRGQKEDEDINLFLRQHPAILLKPGFLIVFFATVIILVFIFYKASYVFFWVSVPLVSISLVIFLFSYLIWRLQVAILTNYRVIVIEQRKIFLRRVWEIDLDKIGNLSYKMEGILGHIFNFGSLLIKSAGEEVEIANIEDPQSVLEKIKHAANSFSPRKESKL
jgi:hypothetical protein